MVLCNYLLVLVFATEIISAYIKVVGWMWQSWRSKYSCNTWMDCLGWDGTERHQERTGVSIIEPLWCIKKIFRALENLKNDSGQMIYNFFNLISSSGVACSSGKWNHGTIGVVQG